MKFAERQGKRLEILKNIYDHHFNNNGLEYRENTKDLIPEDALALDYLVEKGLIKEMGKYMGGIVDYQITVYGIDFIEQYWDGPEEETTTISEETQEQVDKYGM